MLIDRSEKVLVIISGIYCCTKFVLIAFYSAKNWSREKRRGHYFVNAVFYGSLVQHRTGVRRRKRRLFTERNVMQWTEVPEVSYIQLVKRITEYFVRLFTSSLAAIKITEIKSAKHSPQIVEYQFEVYHGHFSVSCSSEHTNNSYPMCTRDWHV
jgi:hypothetical protein